MDEEQMIQLQDSLEDLQGLATRIESGEVQRNDILWRLQSYFHVVGVVLNELSSLPEISDSSNRAVGLLQTIQEQVSDLILDLSARELSAEDHFEESSVLPSRQPSSPLTASIIPFPSRQSADSDESW